MPTILGQVVTAWNEGSLERAFQRVATVNPDPGFDGLAVVASGWVAPEARIVTTTLVNGGIGAAESVMENYRRLHRAIGTVVDQHNRRFDNCCITGVRTIPLATENPNRWHVRAEWLIVPPTARPQ